MSNGTHHIIIYSKLFHHAHNFEYPLQCALHKLDNNLLYDVVTLKRKSKI